MPAFARSNGNLLSTIAVPIKSRLRHEKSDRPPSRILEGIVPTVSTKCRPADARRTSIFAENLSQHARPLTGRSSDPSQFDRGRHEVLVGSCDPPKFDECPVDRTLVAVVAPRRQFIDQLTLDSRIDRQDRSLALQWRRLGLGELIDADHDLLAELDSSGAFGEAGDQAGLQGLDRLERASERQHIVEFGLRGCDQFRGLRFDHVLPSKMSPYSNRSLSNARTCCMRSAHC